MARLVLLSLLALLSGIQSASLPYHGEYDWHFNQMGVHMDLVLKNQVNPLVGGKAHVELPMSAVWKLLEVDQPLLKPLIVALEKSTVGRIYDVMTVKADITFNAEKVMEGIFNVAVDYTLVHRDGTEEKAATLLQGKVVSGKLVTSLDITPMTTVMIPNQIFFPVQMLFTCDWPSAHTLTINGNFGKIFFNIANNMNEVSIRGVWEQHGHQYKYTTVVSLKEKFITFTFQDPTQQLYNIAMKFKMLSGFPMIEITGNVPACHLFSAGEFKTEVMVKNLLNYEIKHIFNGMEMLNLRIAMINGKIEMIAQYGLTHKTHMVIEYELMKWMKIIFPLTNTWLSQDLGIEMHYQPTNEAKLLEGGNIKIVAMRDNVPIMNIGGYYGHTLDSTKYEFLLKDFYVNMLNQEIVQIFGAAFSELKFNGKIFFDLEKMNGFVPRLALEAMLHKDEMKIFHYIFTTTETPYKLHIFCPYVFKNVLNIQNVEHVEITHEHVVLGKDTSITTMCNLTTKKIITKVSPNMMSIELFDGEVSLVKYVSELTKVMRGTNSLILVGKQGVQFNAYQPCFLPKSLCFHELMQHYHLEVVDMAAGKVNVKVMVTKDIAEILNVVVNNMQDPYIISMNVPVLPLEMRIDYEVSTKIANVMINNKNFLQVKPTVANEVEVAVNGIPLFRVALIAQGLKITTITKTVPAITATITWKTFSLFQNTLGMEILVGKIAHKTLFAWNINMLKKAFVDIKMIGSGTELLGDYEVVHHLNWNILSLKNIDVEWNSKVLSTGVTFFKIPMVAQGKLLLKNFVLDLEVVEKLMDVTYTQIYKTQPLTVVLPFFHYP